MNTRFFHASPARARLALLGGLLAAAAGAQAQVSQGVLWDGFRGQPNYVPPGASFDPRYNNLGNQRPFIDNLVAFAAAAANISDAIGHGNVGQVAQIDFTQADDGLCDISARPGSSACVKGLQGMMLYTVIQFPDPGTYTLTFAHNDNVLLNTAAPSTAAADYRTLAYGNEIGYWNSASINDAQYRNADTGAGTITTTVAGEMVPVRIAWNNWGNTQWLRMRWQKPDGTVETVPAANLFNPASLALSAANDTLSQPPGSTSADKVSSNDTVGTPPQAATLGTGGNASVSPDGAWPAGISLNADGTVTVAPGTPPATHTLTYRLCHASHPLCTTAQVTLTVAAATAVTAVPTLGHWGLMLTGLLAAGLGARRLRRRG